MPNIGNPETGGYARLATAVAKLRKETPNSIFLFGGDSLGPSPMSLFDSGSHLIDILNSIEPDAMGVTKREYSYYEEELSLRSYEALFPLIASNIIDPKTGTIQNGLNSRVIVTRGDTKVGILSVVSPEAAQEYLLHKVAIKNVEKSIREQAQLLRNQGAQLIILMHAENYASVDRLLKEGVVDVSLFKYRYEQFTPELKNAISIQGASKYALVDVTLSPDAAPEVNWQSLDLFEMDPDPEVQAQIDNYSYRLDRLLDLPLAQIKTDFNTFRDQVRTSENPFANFVTDAILNYTKADVAILNAGLIRGDRAYHAGQTFTHKHLIQELPFGTRLTLINIYGRDLLDALEISLSQVKQIKGKFPQVANIHLEYDSSKPPFNRIKRVLVKGQPLQLDRLYKLATSDYLYNGGDGFTPLSRGKLVNERQQENPVLSDIVLQQIVALKRLTKPLSGRLIDVHN